MNCSGGEYSLLQLHRHEIKPICVHSEFWCVQHNVTCFVHVAQPCYVTLAVASSCCQGWTMTLNSLETAACFHFMAYHETPAVMYGQRNVKETACNCNHLRTAEGLAVFWRRHFTTRIFCLQSFCATLGNLAEFASLPITVDCRQHILGLEQVLYIFLYYEQVARCWIFGSGQFLQQEETDPLAKMQ